MDSLFSAWQSIPKPAFNSTSNHSANSQEKIASSASNPNSFVNLALGSALKLLGNTSNDASNTGDDNTKKNNKHNNSRSYYSATAQTNSTSNGKKNMVNDDKKEFSEIKDRYSRSGFVKVDGIDIPFPSYTDYQMWDIQPFNPLFIRDRLRRRVTVMYFV